MEQPLASTTATPTSTGATPPPAEPSASVGTSSTAAPVTGEAGSVTEAAAPGESTFTDIDPKSLPPELKAKYDSMLGDYKKKTADIAAKAKDYESLSEKAKLVDMLQSEPAFVNWWNSTYNQQNQQQAQQQPELAQSDPGAVAMREVNVLKANLLVKDFKSQHPDFDELDSNGLITGYVQLNPPKSERDMQSTLEKAYKYAADLKTRWREEGKKEGLARIAEKAQGASALPSNSPNQGFTGDAKKLSVSEAVELARKGIRI